MHNILFSALAKDDIQNIINYYDEINPIITNSFLKELKVVKNHIQQYPETCPKKLKNIRVAFLKRFRYGVFFKTYDDNILVLLFFIVLETLKFGKIEFKIIHSNY